jgi:hypothetical protein
MLAIIQSRIFCLPSHIKNIKIKIHKTVILPVVLYGCETWSLALREENRLSVSEISVSRKTNHGENFIMMNLMACILHLIFLR